MDRFFIACMVFSFISGAYFVVLVQAHRENDSGCVVKFASNKETHIVLGRIPRGL